MHRAGRWIGVVALTLPMVAAAGCDRGESEEAETATSQPLRAPPAPPDRTAAADKDLRVMVAELAAAKACDMMRGQFRPLRAAERPGVATGVFWMKGCRIAQRGTDLTFHLSGDGWQWVEVVTRPAGATFALRQYIRFSIETEIRGALDLAYDPRTHIASFWFTPHGAPTVDFKPVGGADVDEVGAWSSVVGAMGAIAGSSPDQKGEEQSKKRGAHEFRKSFADGFAVTLDLCTGLSRFGLDRPERGKMIAPDLGETRQVPAELHPGGLVINGPHVAERGMSLRIHARTGPVRAELLCQDDAEALAEAFMADPKRLPVIRPLASTVVHGTTTLRTRATSCPVMVVTRPVADRPVAFDWQRPTAETARASGGPIVQCERKAGDEAAR
jgi:hypothetical protein